MSVAAIPALAGALAFGIMGNVLGSYGVTSMAAPLALVGAGIARWPA
jgi:hypothetical protein